MEVAGQNTVVQATFPIDGQPGQKIYIKDDNEKKALETDYLGLTLSLPLPAVKLGRLLSPLGPDFLICVLERGVVCFSLELFLRM